MPTDVIADCAAPVTVAAVPETLPVTLPVNGPEKAVELVVPVTARPVEETVVMVPTPPIVCVIVEPERWSPMYAAVVLSYACKFAIPEAVV